MDILKQIFDVLIFGMHTGKPPLVPIVQLGGIEQDIVDIFQFHIMDLFLCHRFRPRHHLLSR